MHTLADLGWGRGPTPPPKFSDLYKKPPERSIREPWLPSATYYCPLPLLNQWICWIRHWHICHVLGLL